MKLLIYLFTLFLPFAVYSVPQLEWQWISSPQSTSCSSQLVRTTAPEEMLAPEYSVLVVYNWKLEEPCVAGAKTSEQKEIAQWEAKMDDLLASSTVGFSMATITEANQIQYFYYVSDLDAFRTLSHNAGELLVNAELDYEFSRDFEWGEWQRLQSENAAQLYLTLVGEEEE